MTAPTVDTRPGCAASRHDTSSAYKRHGCRCAAARQAEMTRKAKYDRDRTGRIKYDAASMAGLTQPGVPGFHTDPARGCADLRNPDVMFAEHQPGIREAKKVCAGCPFKTECHQWAVDHGQVYGVWGGVSAAERRKELHERHQQQKAAEA